MPHREVLKDLRGDCECENVRYCPLEALLETQEGDRLYEQHKVVEKFKWERSREKGYDIGWETAYKIYCEEGFAKLFAEVYKDGMKHREIYFNMMEEARKRDGKK